MENNKKKVEAILFAVGKEISSERVASLCSLEQGQVEQIIQQLTEDYNQYDHSLKIVKRDSGWKLTVHDEFIPLVSSIVSSTELERSLMETLAVIAWKYPIVQSNVIKLRGSSAYDHIHRLEELAFIEKEKSGKTFKLKLTKKFFEYFDMPSEEAKQAFLKQVPSDILQQAEEIAKEADEIERLINLDQKEQASRDEIRKVMEEVKKEA